MYYPQQSPSISHKLANHHDSNPWRLPILIQQPGQQSAVGPPPPSPGYPLYTNGALQHHPAHHPLQHPPLQHHHQNSLSHYPSPPNVHNHQQHLLAAQGSPAAPAAVVSPHWQQQLLKCEVSFFHLYHLNGMPHRVLCLDGTSIALTAPSSSHQRDGLADGNQLRYPHYEPQPGQTTSVCHNRNQREGTNLGLHTVFSE